jgi:SAM-dependent methyltransferase
VPRYDTFAQWYENGHNSGPGSTAAYTTRYRDFLSALLKQHAVKSVVDWGCGDWQFSRLIDWSGIDYTGVDIVPGLVSRLVSSYANEQRRFRLIDPPHAPLFESTADLLICKDVLQHLPIDDCHDLLQLFRSIGRRVLLINDRHPAAAHNNHDADVGGYRYIDLSLPPFSLPGEIVFEFVEGGEGKTAFLWQQPDTTLYIPKLLHHTWKNASPPDGIYAPEWRASWSRLHPDWVSKLWTDADLLQLAARIDPDVAAVMRTAPGVVKADLGRYLILFDQGGMYADLDYEALRNVEPLLLGHRAVTSWDSPRGVQRRCLNQAWMAAVPGRPIFLHLAREGARRWRTGVRGVESATGPDMFTQELARAGMNDIHALTDKRMCPVHWHGSDGPHGTQPPFMCVYQGQKLTRERIPTARRELHAAGAYAVTYMLHNW